ncbi:MAG: class I adenylate-forming enzyme family protein [Anaerostipes sp.]|jgi:fatty-acyl-CoA synthase
MRDVCKDFNFFQSQWAGDKIAIKDYSYNKSYTYKELYERAEKLAGFLVYDMGLKKGDCIAFCSRNSIAYFDAFFACTLTGIILTTYNHMYKSSEMLELMHNENPKVLFLDSDLADRIDFYQRNTHIKQVVILHDKIEDELHYSSIMSKKNKKLLKHTPVQYEDILMYIHTGGTTGIPKAAMLSYRSIIANAVSESVSFGLNHDDIAYLFLPLFHTGGWNVFGIPTLLLGGRLIISKTFSPQLALQVIEEEKVTVGVAVPTVFRLLTEHEKFEETDFSSVRWLIVGAAPPDYEVSKKFSKRGIVITNAYGMTEVGPNNIAPPVHVMSHEEIFKRWDSVGKPMCLNDVKIIREDGSRVEADEIGELCFRGPQLFSGYLNRPSETKDVLIDGWVHTGDIARQDAEGFIYVEGRIKNMMIVGGENVFPLEIENFILRFPGVKDICVFGTKNRKWGEVPKAIITVNEENFNMEQLKKYINDNLAGVKRPKTIQVVHKIPKNSLGKVDYRTVHEMYD